MEEDIKFIEKMIKEYKTFGDLANPDFENTEKIYKAIENLLKAYKEDEAVIEEMASTLKWTFKDALNHIPSTICTCKEDIRNCNGKICVDCIKDFYRTKVKGEKE